MQTILLAYSGGLDTSVAIHWLKEKYGCDVVAVTVDVGQSDDLKDAMRRAKAIGASRSWIIDARRSSWRSYVLPALKANALYEGNYPLGTAIARPLMVAKLVEMAKRLGADAIAHGCTGKGNDQVRFEVSIMALAPEIERDRTDEGLGDVPRRGDRVRKGQRDPGPGDIVIAVQHRREHLGQGDRVRSDLEDAWVEPPEDIYEWTKGANAARNRQRTSRSGSQSGGQQA